MEFDRGTVVSKTCYGGNNTGYKASAEVGTTTLHLGREASQSFVGYNLADIKLTT